MKERLRPLIGRIGLVVGMAVIVGSVIGGVAFAHRGGSTPPSGPGVMVGNDDTVTPTPSASEGSDDTDHQGTAASPDADNDDNDDATEAAEPSASASDDDGGAACQSATDCRGSDHPGD